MGPGSLTRRGKQGELVAPLRLKSLTMRKHLFPPGLAASLLCLAFGPAAAGAPAAAAVTPPATVKKASRPPPGMPASARQYYLDTWGVDRLSAKLAESGQLVRFDYRVIDAAKAAPLNNRASSPQLLDERAHVVLQVPTMEKVGPLRQSMPPEAGKTYWMVFSNKGGYVKPNHRVSVVIGPVRIDGLIVQHE